MQQYARAPPAMEKTVKEFNEKVEKKPSCVPLAFSHATSGVEPVKGEKSSSEDCNWHILCSPCMPFTVAVSGQRKGK